MSGVYIHLLTNHFPPIVNITALLVLAIGLLHRNDAVVRTSFMVMIFAAVMGIAAFTTGDAAADAVKGMPGVVESAIRVHDESANVSFSLVAVEAAAALAALVVWRGNRTMPRWAVMGILVLALVATAAVSYTAHLGGLIHHPEAKL